MVAVRDGLRRQLEQAALIFLTLLLPVLGMHELPGSPCIQVIWAVVINNIWTFSYYKLQIEAKTEKNEKSAKIMEEEAVLYR